MSGIFCDWLLLLIKTVSRFIYIVVYISTSFFFFLIFFIKKIFFPNFWLCWVFITAHGLSLVVVHGLLIVVASLVVEHRL